MLHLGRRWQDEAGSDAAEERLQRGTASADGSTVGRRGIVFGGLRSVLMGQQSSTGTSGLSGSLAALAYDSTYARF